jgi:hypothetical protein
MAGRFVAGRFEPGMAAARALDSERRTEFPFQGKKIRGKSIPQNAPADLPL